MIKVLHVVSGTIVEADITKNTLNYLFHVEMKKLERNDKEWERVRRFIDVIDKAKIYASSDHSYYRDLESIRESMCMDEFEFLDG